ncbi:uncharacterized protein Pyn_15908 [Prunus yedoensis var. nudiflora]|uniref:Dynein light chain n=1 Tax=Prunus yedoensis var. nudiflora TaxID=2094558 RepID=A0A314ZFF6_PRUYE|nr:uncharacterized protein Pyn_15908 [Prunus yedoensis var. nudiflora]
MEKQKKKAGMSSTYIYNPSSGRHLKPESKPPLNAAMAADKSKTPVLRNWFNLSIRKPKPRPELDVQDEQRQQQGRRGGRGEVVVVEAAARKSVSHVETNLVSVAEFLQVKVLVSDMPGFMQVHAFRIARRTYDSLEKFSSKHMAYNLKKHQHVHLSELVVHLSANWDWTPPVPASNTPRVFDHIAPEFELTPSRSTLE